MKFLITGGAGFIGSHLATELMAQGHEVTIVDDLSAGNRGNVAALEGRSGFRVVVDSCDRLDRMEEPVAAADYIFHLAAVVGVKKVNQAPGGTIRSNLRTVETMLELADRHRRPIFFASSSEVYGKSEKLPYKEDGDLVLGAPTHARWSYAFSKLLNDFMAMAYWKERGLPTTVGRFFNVVGPRQAGYSGWVLPTFVRQALAGAPITVYGNGNQTRCFTHVRDVMEALIGLALNPKCAGQIYNIGSTQEVTVRRLAEMVRERCGSKSEIVLTPHDKVYGVDFEEPVHRVPDTSKIAAAIGWRAKTTLEMIVDDVIADVRASGSTAPGAA